jgi:hypothetical protein
VIALPEYLLAELNQHCGVAFPGLLELEATTFTGRLAIDFLVVICQ